MVNDSPIGFFSSTRGLRQDGPMSPFLFVFVIQAFSRIISVLVTNDLKNSFLIGNPVRGALNIFYLLFVDDTLFFCEVEQNHIQTLRALLLCFEVALGLKVNLDKSKLVYVGNVHNI